MNSKVCFVFGPIHLKVTDIESYVKIIFVKINIQRTKNEFYHNDKGKEKLVIQKAMWSKTFTTKFVDGAQLTFLFTGLNPYLKSNKENITLRHKTTLVCHWENKCTNVTMSFLVNDTKPHLT